jgi:RNA polymerase sigma-70 factor (ECF subfamily)
MCAVDVHEHPVRAESSDTDIKLLARVSTTQALDESIRRYGDRLYVHALYILHDGQEAHDVIQEVFIKALREPRFFDADFKIQAWLYRVTRNLCFNIVRDRRRRENILAANPGDKTAKVDPLEAVFDSERQDEILAAVDQLTPDHREILLLRYYEDLSYVEIASRLEIKLGTVMSRLSRARDRLTEVLGEDTPLRAAS